MQKLVLYVLLQCLHCKRIRGFTNVMHLYKYTFTYLLTRLLSPNKGILDCAKVPIPACEF